MNPKTSYFSVSGSSKADKRETLDRLTLYFLECGHSKATARSRAKKQLRHGKV